MKKAMKFVVKLITDYNKNELYYLGNELTYKMLMAIFPLLILSIYVLSYIHIDYSYLSNFLEGAVPDVIVEFFRTFLANRPEQPAQPETMSSWVLISTVSVAIFSASSGFIAVMRGINRTYEVTDKRNPILQRLISIGLVLLFVIALIVSLVLIIFGDKIVSFITALGFIESVPPALLNYLCYFITSFIIAITLVCIYKISCYKKITFRSTIPGAVLTLVFWLISSQCFNIYVNRFSNYSNIYGNIGTFFILIFWINTLAIVLLVGSQVNAILLSSHEAEKKLGQE